MLTHGVRVQAKGQVTIPKEIRRSLNLKKGDLVVFEETKDGVLLKPVRLYADADLREVLARQVREIRGRFEELTEDEIESLVKDAVEWARDKRD